MIEVNREKEGKRDEILIKGMLERRIELVGIGEIKKVEKIGDKRKDLIELRKEEEESGEGRSEKKEEGGKKRILRVEGNEVIVEGDVGE